MTHTPGPWTVEKDSTSGALWIEDDNGVQTICDLYYNGGDGCVEFPNGPANACLIALAPDLLEALQSFVNSLNLPDDGSEDKTVELYFRNPLKCARAAIAKAVGE